MTRDNFTEQVNAKPPGNWEEGMGQLCLSSWKLKNREAMQLASSNFQTSLSAL